MVHVPDLDTPLRSAANEDRGLETVPLDCVDRGGVGRVGLQVPGGELCGAQVDLSALCTNQVDCFIVRFEGKSSTTGSEPSSLQLLLADVGEGVGEGDDHLV